MQHCGVLDTDVFDIAIGTDFLRKDPQEKMLSLQPPYALHCNSCGGLFAVPLELPGRKESGLRYAARTNYRTANYQLGRKVLKVSPDNIQVGLLASQHFMQWFCSKGLNDAFCFLWKAMGLTYANPPFSLPAKVLTQNTYEGGRVVLCTPDRSWPKMLVCPFQISKNDPLSTLQPDLPGPNPTMMVPAIVREDADDLLSEIASSIPLVDTSCVDLKGGALLAQLLLQEVDLESTSEQRSPAGKPVLHMQHAWSGDSAAQTSGALAQPAANNMPLSGHDAQELRKMLCLKAEDIEQEEGPQHTFTRDVWRAILSHTREWLTNLGARYPPGPVLEQLTAPTTGVRHALHRASALTSSSTTRC